MDPKEWKEPLKFIPERFDENSDYYCSPEGDTKRNPTSFIPFNLGIRNCPGQVLGCLEIKVLILTFLSLVDYEVNQDILDNDYVFLNIVSQFDVEFKPTKIQS